jgi:Uma2 family endonuclease
MKNGRTATIDPTPSVRGEPTWAMAELYPPQGEWTEQEYLDLDVMRLIEFDNGVLEFLPMPTDSHQGISGFLHLALALFLRSFDPRGRLRYAPLKVLVGEKKYREADLLYMSGQHLDRCHEKYWDGADLAIEIVNGGSKNRRRDLVEKRHDYAQARIPEYWIVDPSKETVTVLCLHGEEYEVRAELQPGQYLTSALLEGFQVSVDELFAAAKK